MTLPLRCLAPLSVGIGRRRTGSAAPCDTFLTEPGTVKGRYGFAGPQPPRANSPPPTHRRRGRHRAPAHDMARRMHRRPGARTAGGRRDPLHGAAGRHPDRDRPPLPHHPGTAGPGEPSPAVRRPSDRNHPACARAGAPHPPPPSPAPSSPQPPPAAVRARCPPRRDADRNRRPPPHLADPAGAPEPPPGVQHPGHRNPAACAPGPARTPPPSPRAPPPPSAAPSTAGRPRPGRPLAGPPPGAPRRDAVRAGRALPHPAATAGAREPPADPRVPARRHRPAGTPARPPRPSPPPSPPSPPPQSLSRQRPAPARPLEPALPHRPPAGPVQWRGRNPTSAPASPRPPAPGG